MTKNEAERRIQKLREEINHHRYLYHVLDAQEISDAALDSLKKELADLENQHPDLITADSPTQRVGGQVDTAFQPVPHSTRMLSLQDVFSADELTAWEIRNQKVIPGSYQYFCELKIDGVAIALTYQDGSLTTAATRGNGREGEDVTHNVRTIESIPLALRNGPKGILEVRGEIYMNKKDFEKLNKQRATLGEASYANPRNVAAGSIRQIDPAASAARPLKFFAWELTQGSKVLKTRADHYQTLQALGFATPPDSKVYSNLKGLQAHLEKMDKKHNEYPFQVDGLVIKVNDLKTAERLGIVGKAPRGAIAYKFAPEEATTVVEDIIIQVGRTGAITPIAQLRPVFLAGSTVARATLHNQEEIARQDVRVGDTIVVRKAGDIIPEVVTVLPKLRPKGTQPFKYPTTCPSCGTQLEKEEPGVIIRCPNNICPARHSQHLKFTISQAGFDIEGLGEKVIDQLLTTGLIKTTPDLWKLTVDDLKPLERFADKSAQKLIDEIKAHKTINFWRFIVALGIPHVGVMTAQDIAGRFKNIKQLQETSQETLQNIPGIGPKVARALGQFFAEPINKKILKEYAAIPIKIVNQAATGPLAGKTFLFTGTLQNQSRAEAQQQIISLGARTASSVTKQLDFLVAGDNPGSKLKKAQDLNITILTEPEFKKLLETSKQRL